MGYKVDQDIPATDWDVGADKASYTGGVEEPSSPPPKPPKKKTPVWVFVVIAVAIVAAGAYFAFAGSGDEDSSADTSTAETTDETAEETVEPETLLLFRQGEELFSLNETGEYEATGEKYVSVDATYSAGVVRGNKVVSMEYREDLADPDNFLAAYKIVLSYVDGSSADEVLADSDLNIPKAWLDDDTVLLQKYTCFECDGPPLGEFSTLDITTGNVEELVDINKKSGTEWSGIASVKLTPNSKQMVVIYTPVYLGVPEFDYLKSAKRAVFVYEIATDKLTQLSSTTGKTYYRNSILGFSEDGASVIVSTHKFEDSSPETKVSVKGIELINLSTKKVTAKNLEISDLKGDGYPGGMFGSAYTLGDTLFFVTQKGWGDEASYKLRSLDLTSDEFEIPTILSSKQEIEILEVFRAE